MSADPAGTAGVYAVAAPYVCMAERYLLYVTVLSLPLQALTLLPGLGMTVTKAAGGSLVLAVVARSLLERRSPVRPRGLDLAIALFALACVAAAIRSSDAAASRNALQDLAEYAVVYYAVLAAARTDDVYRHAPALVVLGGALSGLGAVIALTTGFLAPTVDAPVAGTTIRRICFGLDDGNEQAMFLLFALALLLNGHAFWARRRLPWAIGAGAGIAAGLVLTMSRTAWFCAVLLFLARALAYRRPWLLLGAGGAVAAIVLSAAFALRPDVGAAVGRRVVQGIVTGDESIASRVLHYASVAQKAAEGGLTGHGLMTAERVAGAFTTPLGDSMAVTVHNVPYIVWIETGWLGLVAYLWLWANVIGLAWASIRDAQSSASAAPANDALAVGWAAVAATYGVFSLVMPFLYRSSLAVLLACAAAAWLSLSDRDGEPRPGR